MKIVITGKLDWVYYYWEKQVLKQKLRYRDKKEYFITKKSIHHEDITIININI